MLLAVAALSAMALLLGACGPDDDRDLSLDRAEISATADADPVEGSPPLEVSFSADADVVEEEKENLLYTWDFGDGTTSTEQNPTHTYVEEGTYEVSLIVVVDSVDSGSTEERLTVRVAASIDDWTDAVDKACADASMESDAVVAVHQGDLNNPAALSALVDIVNAETTAIEAQSYPPEYSEEIEAWLTARTAFAEAFVAAAEDGMITAEEDSQLTQLSADLQPLSAALDLAACAGE